MNIELEQEQKEYINPGVDIAKAKRKISLIAMTSIEKLEFEFNGLLEAKEKDIEEQIRLGHITEDEAEQFLDEYSLYLKNEILN